MATTHLGHRTTWRTASLDRSTQALACALLVGSIGAVRLDRTSLWFDEAFSVWLTAKPWSTLLDQVSHAEGNQAAYFVLLKLWPLNGELGARLLSVLFTSLAAAILYVVGRRIAGRATGITAALLLGVAPFSNQATQEARGYSLLMLASVALAAALLHARDTQHSLPLALALGFLPYCHTYGLLIALSMAPWAFHALMRAVLVRSVAVGGLLASPMLVWIVLHLGTTQLFFLQRPSFSSLRFDVSSLTGFNHWLAAAFALAASVGGILVLRRLDYAPLLLPWAVTTPVVLVSVSEFHPIYQPRYLAGTFPAFCLLIAIGATQIRVPRVASVLLPAALVLSSGWILRGHPGPLMHEDWRAAGAYVRAHAQPDDRYLGAPCYERVGLFPYDPQAGRSQVCDVTVGATRVWVISRYGLATPPAGFRVVSSNEFQNVYIVLAVR